jgi:hypothetical protein
MKEALDVPVLMITFNRPAYAAMVLEKVRQMKPRTLYVFSDGPRSNKDEYDAVEQCRSLFAEENIDWECEVKTMFCKSNLGCGKAVSSAISWMFDTEPYGIILEDDCLPDDTFFTFCETMLKRYADDLGVMHVSGTRWNEEYDTGEESYFFSRIGHVWGWATWKRAWDLYDYNMKSWDIKEDWLQLYKQLKSRVQTQFWVDNFDRMYKYSAAASDTWDYQWQYTLFKNNGLAVVPVKNLISNIGTQGAHTSAKASANHNRQTASWIDNTRPKTEVQPHYSFDNYHISNYFYKDARLLRHAKWYVKSFLV